MLGRLGVFFTVLVLASVVVGCGDDEKPASGGTGTPRTEDSGGAVSDAQMQAYVESCKEQIRAQASVLSDAVKADLQEICDKAAGGDEEDARQAIVDVCVKVIEESVPEDSGRDQLADQCRSAAP